MARYSLRKNWRGSVLGVLIGAVILVRNPNLFHGNLESPVTAMSYLAALAVPMAIGAFIESRMYRSDKPPIPATVFGTALFTVACLVCVAAVSWIVSNRYPGGAGLLRPTHAQNVDAAMNTCLKARESGFGDSLKATRKFCGCMAEFIATKIDLAETKGRRADQVASEAEEACLGRVSIIPRN